MADPFDAREYFAHLRSRWRPAAVAVTVALAGSLSVSLLLPKKYTARVSLIIEPPASSDSRTATAVTPIYLESLKTYERFASSDDLFARAMERFRLRNPSRPKPIENLKREILRVSVPQSTKIMEIAATYGDPKLAHSLALFLAEETVKLNQKTGQAGDEELLAHGKRSLEAAARRLLGAQSAYDNAQKQNPTPGALEAELDRLDEARKDIERIALSVDLNMAEEAPGAAETAEHGGRLRTLQEQAAQLRRRAVELDKRTAALQSLLARRNAEIGAAETEVAAAREWKEQTEKRLGELEMGSGFRAERLSIVDPGVTPERPSSPNVPLNVTVAGILALLVSLFYLTLEYSLRTRREQPARDVPWMATRP